MFIESAIFGWRTLPGHLTMVTEPLGQVIA
jgi:hypothetical protein